MQRTTLTKALGVLVIVSALAIGGWKFYQSSHSNTPAPDLVSVTSDSGEEKQIMQILTKLTAEPENLTFGTASVRGGGGVGSAISDDELAKLLQDLFGTDLLNDLHRCDLEPKYEEIIRNFKPVFRSIYDRDEARGIYLQKKLKTVVNQAEKYDIGYCVLGHIYNDLTSYIKNDVARECGDGIKGINEECDDGNRSNSDECSNACNATFCGDGMIQLLNGRGGVELCDDGNNRDGDGCDRNCVREAPRGCGNGIVEDKEECDDGNTARGDSCSPWCAWESDQTGPIGGGSDRVISNVKYSHANGRVSVSWDTSRSADLVDFYLRHQSEGSYTQVGTVRFYSGRFSFAAEKGGNYFLKMIATDRIGNPVGREHIQTIKIQEGDTGSNECEGEQRQKCGGGGGGSGPGGSSSGSERCTIDLYKVCENGRWSECGVEQETACTGGTGDVDTGTLEISVDNNNPGIDKPEHVLGGETSDFVASFELTADGEDVEIEDMEIFFTGKGVANIADALVEIVVYDDDKRTELYREFITSTGSVYLNNINHVIPDTGSENIYIKVVADNIGDNENGIHMSDVTFSLSALNIEGEDTGNDIEPIYENGSPQIAGKSNPSLPFAVVPVKITNIQFVSQYDQYVVDTTLVGENIENAVLGILRVVADDRSSTNIDGSDLELSLRNMEFTLEGEEFLSDINIQRMDMINTDVMYGALGGGTIFFDFNPYNNEKNSNIEPGEEAHYIIRGNINAGMKNIEVAVNIENINEGSIVYTSNKLDGDTDIRSLYLDYDNVDGPSITVDNF